MLDDAFIAEYGQVGVKFVFRGGSVWILSGLDEDKVYVRPTEDPVGAIPSWIGEEIPVPREVAEDVGRIKARLAEAVRRGGEAPEPRGGGGAGGAGGGGGGELRVGLRAEAGGGGPPSQPTRRWWWRRWGGTWPWCTRTSAR